MKGIILAGGTGTRMAPMTKTFSKQLLPVYDKPMIYYPITTLLLAGIRDILIITLPTEIDLFKELLGDGHQWGVQFQYAVQQKPEGIPQALIIGESFIGKDHVCLMLGDNLLYGQGLRDLLTKAVKEHSHGATIFAYPVRDPERYGVVTLDDQGSPLSIVEKPDNRNSNLAVIGMYMFDHHVIEIAKCLYPSARGELEISDINQFLLKQNKLKVLNLGRGMAWLDTGTPEALLDASNFIHALESRQGLKICCPEEIAWRLNYINDEQFHVLCLQYQKCYYGEYLTDLLRQKLKNEVTESMN